MKIHLNIILSIYYYFLLIFQVGDGTNFVLVFAGALLDAAEGLLRTVKLAYFVVCNNKLNIIGDELLLNFGAKFQH